MATDHRPSFSLSLALHKFASLLNAPVSRVFQVVVDGVVLGFAITYLIRSGAASNAASQHLKGSLALLAVHPAHQNRGVGVALHTAALQHLEGAVRASLTLSTPRAVSSQLQLGSIFLLVCPPWSARGRKVRACLQLVQKERLAVCRRRQYRPISACLD